MNSTPERRREAAKRAIAKRNPDGVGRAARSRVCRRCGRAVLTGLDDERCALGVQVDPAPLSAAGEVLALLAGRPTYTLTWFAGRGRYEIDGRYSWNIGQHPPGADVNIDVVVAHECGAPNLPRLETMIRRRQRKSIPIDPPY